MSWIGLVLLALAITDIVIEESPAAPMDHIIDAILWMWRKFHPAI